MKELKEQIKKRDKYGNEVEKEFLKKRIKTDNSRAEKIERERLQRVIEREDKIKSLKKPKLHPILNQEKSNRY